MRYLANKIRLYPTPEQEVYFRKACGISRFAYNWALREWKKQYSEGKKPTARQLLKELTAIKREQFPWMLEVTKMAPQYAIENLGRAFKRFFKKVSKYPRFKKRGQKDAFTLGDVEACQFQDKIVSIPRLKNIKMAEPLYHQGRVTQTTIKRIADRWYAIVTVETTEVPKIETSTRENQAETVGVDLGISTFATLSTGEKIPNPRFYTRAQKRLRLLQKSLSRKQKGSKNREKAKRLLSRHHASIANRRNGFIHQLTADLSKRFQFVVIEDLAVSNMMKNRKLSKALNDVGFSEVRRQLSYKLGNRLTVVDRWFPSSKTCSVCGEVNPDLKLRDRKWKCVCGTLHDRDVNAAINLKNVGLYRSELKPVETGVLSVEIQKQPVEEAGTAALGRG